MAAPAAPLAPLYDMVRDYYTAQLARFGARPRGVDWTCVASQEMRFVQLLKLCDWARPFSLNDVGCGYGALLAYLDRRHGDAAIDYLGIDIAPAMLRHARRLWRGRPRVAFAAGTRARRVADYSVASGIFNVRLGQPVALWEDVVRATLEEMARTSRRGFAVNFMAPRPPGERCEPALYRTPPAPWIEHCAQAFGAAVALVDDYGMREFTLLVRPQQTSFITPARARSSRPA